MFDPAFTRVRAGHGKLAKSWNLRISFSLESHGKLKLQILN